MRRWPRSAEASALLLLAACGGEPARDVAGAVAPDSEFQDCAPVQAPALQVDRVGCQRIASAALGGTSAFSYFIPQACSENPRRCPTLYLLHGGGGDFRSLLGRSESPSALVVALRRQPAVDLGTSGDPWNHADPAAWVSAVPLDLVLVAPHGRLLAGGHGPATAADGGWVDWNPRYAADGDAPAYATPAPRFEGHLLDEVIPFVEKHLPVASGRESRALLGHSLGGYGASVIALRHPDRFAAMASVSMVGSPLIVAAAPLVPGLPVTVSSPLELPRVTLPGMLPALLTQMLGFLQDAPIPYAGALAYAAYAYGDPVSDRARYLGHAPQELAINVRASGGVAQSLRIHRSVNNGLPWPKTPLTPETLRQAAIEQEAILQGVTLGAVFELLGVESSFEVHPGTHTQWQPYARQLLTILMAHLHDRHGGGHPAPAPSRFDYRSIDRQFTVWGWTFRRDAQQEEFLDLRDVSCEGLTLQGSGRVDVSVPPSCGTGLAGHANFRVDLGPAAPTDDVAGLGDSGAYGSRRRVALTPLAEY